jgi:hypothetical protein
MQLIFEKSIDELATLVEEGARATKKTTARFIEPAQGTLRRAESRRHHIVFGRRGSGKSSLLYKSAENLSKRNHPVAYVDLEPFKGHHYPDILISVLLASLDKFKDWLLTADITETRKRLWYTCFLKQEKSQKSLLVSKIDTCLNELIKQLYLSDDTPLREKCFSSKSEKDSAVIKSKAGFKNPVSDSSIETDIASAVESNSGKEIQEEFKRSKIDYLHRKILDFHKIFNGLSKITGVDCFLFLDDLYHIRKVDQPNLLDYFHRIAKGNSFWLKIGTIKNRSTWYIHSPQPIGLKLGDDADDINLDLTLEKFSVSKEFLKSVLESYIESAQSPSLNDFIADGGLDRLVIASGGVTRDFLGIFRRSIDETRERLTKNKSHPRGEKIGAEDVNVAAGAYGETKMEEFKRDTLEDQKKLDEAFNKIRIFCIDKTKSNIFLLDQDQKGIAPELVQELIDLRLVHHIKSRVTVSSHPGKIYRALLLDVSQYTGERKRRDLEMIDFWKESNKETIRRAIYIYDPNLELKDLEKLVQTQKTADEKKKVGAPIQLEFR